MSPLYVSQVPLRVWCGVYFYADNNNNRHPYWQNIWKSAATSQPDEPDDIWVIFDWAWVCDSLFICGCIKTLLDLYNHNVTGSATVFQLAGGHWLLTTNSKSQPWKHGRRGKPSTPEEERGEARKRMLWQKIEAAHYTTAQWKIGV